MYEGYMLYPYGPYALKNRKRDPPWRLERAGAA